MKNQRISFQKILATIFSEEDMKIANLFRFSDMAVQDADAFWVEWAIASAEKQTQILKALAEITEENFEVDFAPIFKQALQSKHESVRKFSLDGLWDSDDVSLITPIIQLMIEDESMDVQKTATATLAHYVTFSSWGQVSEHAGNRVIDALVARYKDPDISEVLRNTALEGLGASGHPELDHHLQDAYENGSSHAQKSALFAMGNTGDEKWLSIATDELESPYSEMRTEAARALGGIGDEESINGLMNLIYDDDSEVQVAVLESLAKIGGRGQEILQHLLEDEDVETYHDYIEQLLEEMDWMSGTFDLDNLNLTGGSDLLA